MSAPESYDDDLSFWEQTAALPSLKQRISTTAKAVWVHSYLALALKRLIVRLGSVGYIKRERADFLVKWLGLKHA